MPADGRSIMPAALQRAHRVALGCLTAWLVACGGGGGVDPAAPAPSAAVTPGAVALDTTDLDPAAAAQLANDEPGESGAEAVPATTSAVDDAGASTPEVETPSPTAPAPAIEPPPSAEPPLAEPPTDTPPTAEPPASRPADDPTWGLEAGASVEPTGDGQMAVLSGLSPLAGSLSDATGTPFDVDPGRLSVQYQGGDASERLARVAADPSNPANHVLEFLLQAANVRDADGNAVKGRVQLNAYAVETVRAREVRLRMRMKLADGFEQLRSLDRAFRWLTLSEWWNDAGWTGQAYPFRITVDVTKPVAQAGSRLFFGVRAETLNVATQKWDTTVWSQLNTAVPVPLGEWVTLEYHFREGDASEGRFYMAMVPDDGQRVVLFDHRGWTHHPDNPAPDGLTHLNPAKLYTSKVVIDHAAAAGHPLRVHWDDLGFRLCRQRFDAATSPCRPETFR